MIVKYFDHYKLKTEYPFYVLYETDTKILLCSTFEDFKDYSPSYMQWGKIQIPITIHPYLESFYLWALNTDVNYNLYKYYALLLCYESVVHNNNEWLIMPSTTVASMVDAIVALESLRSHRTAPEAVLGLTFGTTISITPTQFLFSNRVWEEILPFNNFVFENGEILWTL